MLKEGNEILLFFFEKVKMVDKIKTLASYEIERSS